MTRSPRRPLAIALIPALVVLSLSSSPSVGAAPRPIEAYASYVPASHCSPSPKPGTLVLAAWLVRAYGGGRGPISRPCHGHATSEHQEGRAFDWTNDVHRAADRKRVQRLFHDLLATDAAGNQAALARRLGVMYLIWNDHLYGAWNHFAPEPYLSSSCPSLKKCSADLRHRTHVHLSLSRAGAWGFTSWYAGRVHR